MDGVTYNVGAEPTNAPCGIVDGFDLAGLDATPLESLVEIGGDNAYISPKDLTDLRENVYQGGLIIGHTSDLMKPANIEFLLDGEYSRFCGKLVAAPSMDKDDQTFVTMYADGKLVFYSGLMAKRDRALLFDVDVSGASSLEINHYNTKQRVKVYVVEAFGVR